MTQVLSSVDNESLAVYLDHIKEKNQTLIAKRQDFLESLNITRNSILNTIKEMNVAIEIDRLEPGIETE